MIDEETDHLLAQYLSWLCGWGYVLLWSTALYPQPILNFRRRSTEGLAFDFPLLNLLGSTCYTISSALFLYSPVTRAEYADRHPSSPKPTVRLNDLCFAAHQFVLCCIVFSQFWPAVWRWRSAPVADRHANVITKCFIGGSAVAVILCVFLALTSRGGSAWGWLDVVYAISFIKLGVTLIKNPPQALSNYRRKSTLGFSMFYVFLDLGGSILGFIQLLIDSSLQSDWSGLFANPVKLGLALISATADFVFLVQHFVLYGAVVEGRGLTSNGGHAYELVATRDYSSQ